MPCCLHSEVPWHCYIVCLHTISKLTLDINLIYANDRVHAKLIWPKTLLQSFNINFLQDRKCSIGIMALLTNNSKSSLRLCLDRQIHSRGSQRAIMSCGWRLPSRALLISHTRAQHRPSCFPLHPSALNTWWRLTLFWFLLGSLLQWYNLVSVCRYCSIYYSDMPHWG